MLCVALLLLYLSLVSVVMQGHFVRVLGDVGDKETENEVLLLEHDVPHQPFPQIVLSDLPAVPWIISDEVNTMQYVVIYVKWSNYE